MIEILKEVEENLGKLLLSEPLYTMFIDYHKPYVERIFFNYKGCRINLHKIYPGEDSSEMLFHPHPWESIIRVISGRYEMGIGHSETNEMPTKIDCKIWVQAGNVYEMNEPDGWHYVKPEQAPSYSLMAIGKYNYRGLQKTDKHIFRRLDESVVKTNIKHFEAYYDFELKPGSTLFIDGKEIVI